MKILVGFAESATNLKSGDASARSLAVGTNGIAGARAVSGWNSPVAEGESEPKSTW